MAQDLYHILKEYSRQDYYPFHMPGHKRQMDFLKDSYAVDITEIDGFDNLHHPEGILLEAEQRAAKLYGSEETHYLINGSTAGLLSAISACSRRGGKVLMARNCHKAAYHAVFLNGLHVSWLYPETDMTRGIYKSIDPDAVRRALEKEPKGAVSAVILTSPTYDGVVSDIRRIAEAVHAYGAVLIVDEAHGAHFAMHPYFPESAVECGADIVINSLHKTMPAPTQTGLIHVNGPWADRVRLKKYLGIYQTSSPSYILMAGIDRCVTWMSDQKQELFEAFKERLEQTRDHLSHLKCLHLVTGCEPELAGYLYDPSRIVISTENSSISGLELYRILLERYHLQLEMAAEHYATVLTSVMDTQAGFDRLCRALDEIDLELAHDRETGVKEGSREMGGTRGADSFHIRNEEVLSLEEAESGEMYEGLLAESAGHVSGEYVYLYPPGIPLLIPGERISRELLERLELYRAQGFCLQGQADYTGEKILLIKENGAPGAL